ncbi:LamG domain-containing protein [Silicimonas algicola]|uniref:Concanavalin A-like lectin/glucanase superfamily protein n=1 Tax=Silicimonas algicola TaxID=1826607 RepID=A0A316FQ41_9RHOB|nr:LamG domain-containing protein [Silicimonas algicola]PWK49836.1 concanavalin A-like lectin/glucanase superfamily protein [Silicimonas algicola]
MIKGLSLAGAFLAAVPMSIAAEAVDGLIGQWAFDEQHGEHAADTSGNGHDGSLINGAWGQGVEGGALLLDGGNDGIVTISMADQIKETRRSITLMAWTYRTDEHNVAVVASSYPMLFLGFHGPQFKLELTERPGLLARVAQKLGLADEVEVECYADMAYVAELNRWIHLAATYDGEMARLYADGQEVCALPFSGIISFSDRPLTIGGYLDKNGSIVDEITGRIDDVRLYNRPLSADEVRAYFEDTGALRMGQ